MRNERQDYFGQTVNVAPRVQPGADTRATLTTGGVINNIEASRLFRQVGFIPTLQSHVIQSAKKNGASRKSLAEML
jgi:class 3 adenylate cyclase